MISHTSLLAYADIVIDGTAAEKRAAILDLLRMFPHKEFSRHDIHTITGIQVCSVTGRVNELIADGLAVDVGTKVDPVSKKVVKTLKFAPPRDAPN